MKHIIIGLLLCSSIAKAEMFSQYYANASGFSVKLFCAEMHSSILSKCKLVFNHEERPAYDDLVTNLESISSNKSKTSIKESIVSLIHRMTKVMENKKKFGNCEYLKMLRADLLEISESSDLNIAQVYVDKVNKYKELYIVSEEIELNIEDFASQIDGSYLSQKNQHDGLVLVLDQSKATLKYLGQKAGKRTEMKLSAVVAPSTNNNVFICK